MILGDNPAGHCFVLRDLVLIELFQISHDCVTKYRLKTYLKAIRDTFFPNVWNFPICDIFIQQKGTLPLPSLVGYPDFPMRKTLRVVGLLIL